MGHAQILLSRDELRQMSIHNDAPLAAGRGCSQGDVLHGPKHYTQQLMPPWDELPGRTAPAVVPLAEAGAELEAATRAPGRALSETESARLDRADRWSAERWSLGLGA